MTTIVIFFHSGSEGVVSQASNIFKNVKNDHIAIIFLISVFLLIGHITGFFAGRFFQKAFAKLRYPNFPERSLYCEYFWRLLKRRKLADLFQLTSYVKRRKERIYRLDLHRFGRTFGEDFTSLLTSDGKRAINDLPEIVKRGIINPLLENWEICVNYFIQSSTNEEKKFIIDKENNKKSIFMIIYSVYGGIVIALILHFPDIVDGIHDGLTSSEINKIEDSTQFANLIKFAIGIFLLFRVPGFVYSYYRDYCIYCGICYVENRALQKYLHISASEELRSQDDVHEIAEVEHSMQSDAIQRMKVSQN